MDVMITGSKRRRLDDEPRRRQQQPPPGAVGGGEDEEEDAGRVDLISHLPDGVLGDVITLLPAADGARTQILSRRWRPLWRYSPLNLEANNLAVAQAILSSHRGGPGRRFSLSWRDHHHGFSAAVDDVLRRPGLDGLQEFDLRYSPIPIGYAAVADVLRRPGLDGLQEFDLRYSLIPIGRDCPPTQGPPSLLRFSPTLRVLTICTRFRRIEFPGAGAAACCALGFPRLEQLTLNGVVISESTLHGILSRCPVLQSLVLQGNIGYRRLQIISPTLRSLGISDVYSQEGKVEEVVVEDAPLLERIITDGRGLACGQQIRVIQARKLKIIGYLVDSIYEFGLGTRIVKNMKTVSLPNAMRTVKILALKVAPGNLDVVIDFLTWFPCVAKLYMTINHWVVKDGSHKLKNVRRLVSLECLDEHLKMLELESYRGTIAEVSLIRFFISNARVLESLKVLAAPGEWSKKMITSLRKKLNLGTRASRGARFYFVPHPDHRLSSYLPMKHIHNLALDDPFDKSSCLVEDTSMPKRLF